jgi:hypothetical protein
VPELPHTVAALTWLTASAFILLWNILLAGQIAQARGQSRAFIAVTALCGLFVAPGVLVAIAAPNPITGRAIHLVGWLWPVTLALFVIQGALAVRRRLVSSFLAIPILASNVVLFLVASVRFASQYTSDIPAPISGITAAHASVLGLVWGREALWSPLALQLPLLVPAFPARWRLSKTLRALLSASAAVTALLVAIEYAPGTRAVATFGQFAGAPLQERPQGDLGFGLRILPTLRGAPASVALQRDLPLADSLGVSVVLVRVTPSGARALPLDSLNVSLAPLRTDSVLLAVSLGFDRQDRQRYAASPADYRDRRLAALEQVMRRLRPDVLMPATDLLEEGQLAVGDIGTGWWTEYLTAAARSAHELRPRTRVATTVSAFTTADSALYAWAVRSPDIDLVGFSFSASFGGGASLAARHRVAQRWMLEAQKPHWVFAARAYPWVFGERSQELAMLGSLTWATRQPRIQVVVFDGAGDYDALTGLRTSGGRLRPAVASLDRARRALEETSVAVIADR